MRRKENKPEKFIADKNCKRKSYSPLANNSREEDDESILFNQETSPPQRRRDKSKDRQHIYGINIKKTPRSPLSDLSQDGNDNTPTFSHYQNSSPIRFHNSRERKHLNDKNRTRYSPPLFDASEGDGDDLLADYHEIPPPSTRNDYAKPSSPRYDSYEAERSGQFSPEPLHKPRRQSSVWEKNSHFFQAHPKKANDSQVFYFTEIFN